MTPDPSLPTALALLALEPALGGLAVLDRAGWDLEPCAHVLAALLPPVAGAPPRVLRLPAHIAPAALLGGLDLEASIAAGRRATRAGLLAAHDGGVLWLPDPDLLDPAVAGPLAAALRHNAVRVEREGLSAVLPARLRLLTAAPRSGARYLAVLACAGLWLDGQAVTSDQWPVASDSGISGDGPRTTGHGTLENLTTWLADARERLPAVRIAGEQVAELAAAALRLGVAGHRVDYLASRAACASAALAGRLAVTDRDLELAVALVLAPRATRYPAPPDPPPPNQAEADPQPNPPDGQGDRQAADTTAPPSALSTQHSVLAAERLIAAQAAYLPPEIVPRPAGVRGRRGPATSGAGRMAGERHLLPARHGRPGPAQPAPRRPPDAALDLAATLEAAVRRQAAGRAEYAPADEEAAPAPAIRLQPDDLRWRTPQAPPGVLFILAVDASGSMARNRLGPAKGAALLLLERAYRHRDRVALIGVRGPQAQLLLPPTRSVARARRLLDSLPAGGGTPLASALARAWDLAAQAALTGYRHTLLVLLTDGRANVPLAGPATPDGIAAELAGLAARWAGLSASGQAGALVVDTRLRYLGGGEAATLAAALVGRYLYLPHATPQALEDAAEHTAAALGWRG